MIYPIYVSFPVGSDTDIFSKRIRYVKEIIH